MEKDKKSSAKNQPDPQDVFPDSDPELDDLKELKVEPFTESDIFLDKKPESK